MSDNNNTANNKFFSIGKNMMNSMKDNKSIFTPHFFKLMNENSSSNKKSVFGKFSNILGMGKKYFNSEWSFAQFKVNSPKSICTFEPDNSIIVVSNDGKYYHVTFDPKAGGECTKVQEQNIF